ncbi:MAG TPA: alpha/beta fold hydrolase [Acetobacteraceae bacterium]|nr:alpha/beta fold hydrolase [Acetobacteraceae bacterium]
MDDVTRDRFTFSDFRLESGEVLPEVTIAYSTRGRLAADGRNAVLVTHGFTSGHQMIEPTGTSSEGSWTTLVGPGAPVDTERNYVVASNMLGSSFGSTNASFTDPRTGKWYGSRFPRISLGDIVTAQHHLLQHLGVKHLRAVVGPSYGGFQAFQWAVSYPDFMDGIVPVVSAPKARLNATADTRERFERDPNWNGGDYYDTPGGMRETMIALRIDTLRRYGMADEAAIRRAAEQWANVFDANSLLILGQAMETFDVTERLGRIKVPVLYVLSRTDALFPPERAPVVMLALRDAGVDARYCEIDSDKGHLASGADAEKWAPALRDFMRRVGAAA